MIRNIIMWVAIVVAVGLGLFFYMQSSGKFSSSHLLSVEKIENIGKLELVKFHIKDVLEQRKDRSFFLPSAKAIVIISGEVIAGINLEKVTKEDIVVTGHTMTITLPKPEILSARVNHSESKVYDVKWGGFSEVELIDEAYREAEWKLRQEAISMGYEATCKKNAVTLLTPMFSQMSGKDVEIKFKN